MNQKIYIFADLLAGRICANTCNFWTTAKEQETGLYQTDTTSFQLLEIRTIEVDINFDFTTGKIQALENKLGHLHIQAENIKAQIQELKCLGHDSSETNGGNGGKPPMPEFDDDIPF